MPHDSATAVDRCADAAGPRAAAEAGLRYVADVEPGLRRRRRGRGFSYHADPGVRISNADRKRIAELVIPPAWTDVWICADDRGHLQATGRDARGRKQYRYHPRWTEVRDEAKFDSLAQFGAALPELRRRVNEDLATPGLPHRKVTALVVALLDRTLIRVGNDRYRTENGSYGLTTLETDQVDITGATIEFTYVGKSGQQHSTTLRDRRLARAVRACHELGGRELFTYRGENDEPERLDSSDCNDYLAAVVGEGTTVKTFRTWGASALVLGSLLDPDTENGGGTAVPVSDLGDLSEERVVAAVDLAARALGNTRAVCRRSYVHPALCDEIDPERLISAWRSARSTLTMTRAERALLHLLEA